MKRHSIREAKMPSLPKSHQRQILHLVLAGLAVCGVPPRRSHAQETDAGPLLFINEVMASNTSVLADPQGEYDDWIEVHNAGDLPLDLAGLFLTDDLDEPARWQFPVDQPELTTIPPLGYLLVWTDGDTQDAPGLHTSFNLDGAGEQAGLFDADGQTLIDAVTFARQRPDVSFGRFPDANDAWQYMIVPTPGAANVRASEGFVADVEFSRERGFYDQPISVTLTTDTEGADIWYTTDGTEPYLLTPRTINGTIYTGPIEISRTACLRAKAIKPGWEPSTIRTHTYIFLDNVLNQPPLPRGFPKMWGSNTGDYGMDPDIVNHPLYRDVLKDALLTHRTISLTFNIPDLFHPDVGIYVNAQNEGVAWERPVSMEIIDPGGGPQIHVNAGLRMQGSASRSPSRPKHNMRLLFKGQYGATKLEFPMFENWSVERFDTLILRGSNGDSWIHPNSIQRIRAQYIRDQWPRDTQFAMGRLSPGQCYVHLYLNGLYWGLYHVIEKPNAAFFAEHLGGEKEEYDVVQHKNLTVDGNRDAWNAMMAIANRGLASAGAYEQIHGYIDVPNMIDWLLVNFYNGNVDWDHNNWFGGRRRVPGAGFRFFCWDSERTFLDLDDNVTGKNNSNQPTRVHQQLTANADYRMLFADHAHRHFFNGGVLTPESAESRWLARADEIRLALVAESARWGDAHRANDPYTPDEEWQAEHDLMCNEYFPQRSDIVLGQLRARNMYPSTAAPTFNLHGGAVPRGFPLTMQAPAGTIWYTLDGSDPRLPQTSESHVTGKTLLAENAPKRVLVPTQDIGTDWRGGRPFSDSTWTPTTGGVGYERSTGYEQLFTLDVQSQMDGGNPSCYIRVPFTFDGSTDGWDSMILKVRYDDGFVAYLNGVEIARRNFTGEPAWNSSADSGHSDGQAVEFENVDVSGFIKRLRAGENLLAIQGLNVSSTSSDFLISVELAVTSGGPPADVSPAARVFDGPVPLSASALVKSRAISGNTWSALNEAVFAVGPVAESLRISEIMYHPVEPNDEFIELTNIGAETINLKLVRFDNGIDFAVAGFELAPGDFCLVVKDIAAFEARYGVGFNIAGQYAGSLNNAGERVELQDAAGQVIHDFRFEDGWYDITDGLGFSLTVKDPAAVDADGLGDKSVWRPSAHAGGSPGFDDSDEMPALGSVVINELLANSVGGVPDWIELHNMTDQAIDIGGWFLSDDRDELTKYEIAPGTTIPAGGYLVFDQDRHFGNGGDPGCHDRFALSRDGETVYLHSGADGLLGGYSEQEKFDASEPGVSLGRHEKSTGAFNFVALSTPTPGAANAYPQVGPVVINEIMYHPDTPADAEYVELLNIGDRAVMLYDVLRGAPWRFTDDPDDPGIELLLPSDPPVTLAPGEYLVLVKDAGAFSSRFSVPQGMQVFAWGAGNLANGSEKIQLSKPGDEEVDGTRHWFRVDRVVYSDGVHHDEFPSGVDPWPTGPDGHGTSLSRIEPGAYGNDPANWQAAAPSPGSAAP